MKRVIIFHISDFGGHSKAAENIKEAFLSKVPDTEVLSLNGFGYFYPRVEQIVDFVYTTVIKHLPHLWGRIYDRKILVKNLSPLRRWVHKITFKKLSALIKNFNPDCFVTTQAFPCGLVADFKEKYGLKVPLIAVVTDYYPHRFWIHPSINKYVVACEEAKGVLINEGVKAEEIEILGIPVSIRFLTCCPRQTALKDLGLIENLTAVLIMGGGLGIGPIEKIAQALDALDTNFQIISICGKNGKLYKWFARCAPRFRKPLFYFGYTDLVHKIMDCSDIIITKGGGITISEALSKGLGIIITNPIPGQEERNANYLSGKKAILRIDDISRIGETVKMLFEKSENLTELRKKAKEISRVDSSLQIVDLILKAIA